LNEGGKLGEEAYADASPFRPKQKTPLSNRLAKSELSGIPLHPTVRAAVEAAL
jgi:hypothetical protein